MSSRKRKNLKLRKSLKEESCLACGQTPGDSFNPIDPAHVRTFKVTQSDHPANIVPLCRRCHNTQHRIGWKKFISNNSKFGFELELRGWVFHLDPFNENRLILTHPEVA